MQCKALYSMGLTVLLLLTGSHAATADELPTFGPAEPPSEPTTRNGAEALGLEDQLGTIEAGKLADVIVVARNLLADLSALKNVYSVIKG